MASEARDDQRQRVLDVAAGLFAEHGFDDVTMADIAAEADVARATVFNYFGSKRALIEAITEMVLVHYRDMLDEALADTVMPTPAILRQLYERMAKGIESERQFFRGVFREIVRIQLGLDEGSVAQRANDDAIERLVRVVERGQQRGELSDRFDAASLAGAFRSLANGTITSWLYDDAPGTLLARMTDAVEVFLLPVEVHKASRGRTKGAASKKGS
jgi:AcrR family transcriptional regulator